jgi:hypothetical protein
MMSIIHKYQTGHIAGAGLASQHVGVLRVGPAWKFVGGFFTPGGKIAGNFSTQV